MMIEIDELPPASYENARLVRSAGGSRSGTEEKAKGFASAHVAHLQDSTTTPMLILLRITMRAVEGFPLPDGMSSLFHSCHVPRKVRPVVD